MSESTAELQRARRRYKALVRERGSLASSGASDPVVEEEIRKLEEKYAELKPHSPPPLPGHCTATSAPVAPSATSEEVAKPSLTMAPSASPSTELHLTPSMPQPCAPTDELRVEAVDTDHQARAAQSRAGAQLPAKLGSHLVLFFLRLFNETHQKSLLGCWNCAAIVALSIVVAVLHCTVLDPSSTAGSLITPSFLCCLVHASNLASLYTQHRRRLSAPMLVVYVCLDAVPSLALDLVVYNLSLTLMGFYGLHPASFVC
ncbi:hypothetical protein CGC20_4350 [Leishmania donovani]|uniref:Uncharacterized protein n=3 Tax=Leishmania donovani species complex TaxID=38574 RepID=A4HRF7_LEIIN|nr:conserved hypothetical protein [Leishmania infantum JPCM5]TPP49188.1 hypothetical protein CGC20_4350 [Leishmania donovani]CAC9436613.1 hypothetical_protein_-_conserved [Leishmania infantum]CAM65187.1 conserved hypothetical protein [Leishmania infantum JPCM5]SUZ38574.1 hypothetical_protein_-_conserved [Leishmania infantum]VDZ41526.1 hypothetical_protein_conserved [Leishmania donovani]|eukprot:XP_001462649.1 conserved hypothetical protein [Leishmania infantum JPCM5]